MRKLIRHWLGIDNIESKVDNITTAHDIIVHYRKHKLFHGQLENMTIRRSLTDNGSLDATVKFKAKDLTSLLKQRSQNPNGKP